MLGKLATSSLCFLLATSIGSSAFAIELYKGRVVSHKEWSTGNAKATFKHAFGSNDLFKSKMMADPVLSYVSVVTRALKSTGNVNTPAKINGLHGIYVRNDSPNTRKYQYTLSICADTTDHNQQCGFYFDEVQLETGGFMVVDNEPELTITFTKPGSYRTFTMAYLSSDDQNSMGFTNASAESSIEIS